MVLESFCDLPTIVLIVFKCADFYFVSAVFLSVRQCWRVLDRYKCGLIVVVSAAVKAFERVLSVGIVDMRCMCASYRDQ